MAFLQHFLGRHALSTLRYSHLSSKINGSPLSLSSQSPCRIYPLSHASSPSRFFSSNQHHFQRWVRHPRTDHEARGNGFFKSLDFIPQNAIFNTILIINGVVFVMWYMSEQRLQYQRDPSAYRFMLNNFIASWSHLKAGHIWTLVTSCFSHKDVAHILFNGFTFFFMAKPVLNMLGTTQFLVLYLGSGIVANLVSMGYSNAVEGRDKGSMGASASIYSTISFLACVAPRMTFQLYGIIPIPAWLAVSGIFAYDTYSTVTKNRSQTDTVGHVAGLVSGIGYYLFRRSRIFF